MSDVSRGTADPAADRSRYARWFVDQHGLRAGWKALLFAVIWGATLAIVGLIIRTVVRSSGVNAGNTAGPRFTILGELVLLSAAVVATAVMARIDRRPFWSYGLIDRRGGARFAVGLISGFIALSALVGLLALTGHLAFAGQATTGLAAARYAALWGFAFLLVGAAEELTFRGYLQQTLARGIGFWPAAVLLSILFGALHAGNGGEAIIGLIGAGLAGFMFAVSLWRAGSLWWAIGFHTAWDWAESYFYGTADSGTVAAGHLLTTRPAGAAWLSGGTVGPEGSVFVLLVFVAVIPLIYVTLRPAPDGDSGRLAGHVERRDPGPGGEVDRVDRAGVRSD